MLTVGLGLGALALGLLIALVDTSPKWDDTGITVGMLVIVCALFGMLSPARAWLWALAVGLWIPVLNIALYHNYASSIALVFAFFGAYVGAFARKLIMRAGNAT
jgi:hypothetical protein